MAAQYSWPSCESRDNQAKRFNSLGRSENWLNASLLCHHKQPRQFLDCRYATAAPGKCRQRAQDGLAMLWPVGGEQSELHQMAAAAASARVGTRRSLFLLVTGLTSQSAS